MFVERYLRYHPTNVGHTEDEREVLVSQIVADEINRQSGTDYFAKHWRPDPPDALLVSKSGKPGIQWVARDLKPPIFNQAAELFASGRTVRQVKEILGISHGEAGRLRLRAAAEGLLESSGENEEEEAENAIGGRFGPN